MEVDATRVLVGLDEFVVLAAREVDGELIVEVAVARAEGVAELAVDEFQSLTGQGLRGKVDGATLLLGRRELLESGPLAEWAKKLPPAAAELSEVWVIGRDLVGRILLQDQIRAESRGVLAELKRRGVRTVMLTGLTRDGTFLIENGKITQSLKNFRWNESPLFLLNKIDEIGRAEPTGAGQVMPSLRAKDFNFQSLSDAV